MVGREEGLENTGGRTQDLGLMAWPPSAQKTLLYPRMIYVHTNGITITIFRNTNWLCLHKEIFWFGLAKIDGIWVNLASTKVLMVGVPCFQPLSAH